MTDLKIETAWGSLTVRGDSSLPENTVIVVGSCDCRCGVMYHNAMGCGGCDCDVPIERLLVKLNVAPGGPDEHGGY